MTTGEHYRTRARELLALAQTQASDHLRDEFENLAAAYLRLAEQADRHPSPPLAVEFNLSPDSDKPKSDK